jgi:hypothetical protein
MTGTDPTVCVDWDGTCVEFAWPERTRQWKPGAIAALHEMSKVARVVIMSSRLAPFEPCETIRRTHEQIDAEVAYIRGMLDEAGLGEVIVWDMRNTPWKPGAVAYIDDKGWYYDGKPDSWARLTVAMLVQLGELPAANAFMDNLAAAT